MNFKSAIRRTARRPLCRICRAPVAAALAEDVAPADAVGLAPRTAEESSARTAYLKTPAVRGFEGLETTQRRGVMLGYVRGVRASWALVAGRKSFIHFTY